MLGSQLVIRALRRRGVTTIFSLSGNQIMPLYDACIDAGIRIVHVRHEAAAVFMADGWAQVTGEIGVAVLTAGPGVTNGIAPLYSAAQAESPVLLISGDSSVAEDGMGAFQEMDQVSITKPLTKLSRRPATAHELAPSVDDAISTALAPRRGPVHLALPFDLLCNESGIGELPPLRGPAAVAAQPDRITVDALGALLAQARHPVVLSGPSAARSGVRSIWHDLGTSLQTPVIPLESPRGLKDPSAGTFAGLLPQTDLIVLAGKRLDFSLGFGRSGAVGEEARVVVLDPDPAMLTRARHLLGDRLVLACECEPAAVLQRVAQTRSIPSRTDWLQQVAAALANRDLGRPSSTGSTALTPRALCEEVQRYLETAREPILVCDGGEFGQWAQAFCRAPARIINGMSGAIGGGICHAIAASIARPDATVVALMGDGTSGFHLMEFDTAVRERARFIAVIGNDLRWNAEHLIQTRTYGADRLIGCELAATARYHDAAAALGGFGADVRDHGQIAPALRAAAASGLPGCINVAIEGEAAPAFGAATTAH
ncbi:MAG TPA: thiamine pyrophosphate-binding protein [Burkholderiaceae bacterium]|nr:thiamine pyrophosphate-binding protein [Burkholderiaceae bacterium]